MALGPTARGVKWTLTRQAFDRLLAEFDPDPSRAAVRYEHTRRALTFRFERRGCPCAADLADEVFDRVARKLDAGEDIRDLPRFFHGVARHVLQEYWHDHPHEPVALNVNAASATVGTDTPLQDCLDDCLTRLAPDERALMIEYYQGEKGAKILNRKRLADVLGVSMNVLSLRAFRLRAALRACVTSCLER